jgi:hypothetical protein
MMVNLRDPVDVFYLPVLRDTSPSPAPEDALEPAPKEPVVASAPRTKRLVYPGPQPIFSDFPEPTNRFQTVLQPDLKNPTILPLPLSLPNVVQMADAGRVSELQAPVPPVKAPDVEVPATQQTMAPPIPKPEFKAIEAPVDLASLPIEAAKLVLPISPNTTLPEATPLPLPSKPVPQETVPVAPVQNSSPPKAVEQLLALSPSPAPREESVNVPLGEARGRFAISPEPNLSGYAAEVASNPDTPIKSDPTPLAPTANGASGTAAKDASNSGSAATRGSGVVAIPGTSKASPSSTAGAPGRKSPFSGITILGGVKEPKPAGSPAPVAVATVKALPQQTKWGMMVLSTESSGGGLPQFGVFQGEHIYTVYLDMRKTTADSASSWIFEYAVQTADQATDAKNTGVSEQGLVLPFPAVRSQPVLPAEIARKYPRQLVVVYCVINVDGKAEQVSVKDSPDVLLNGPILEALSTWNFQPAQVRGKTVPMKLLLGIPLS